jgi:hypothetical protein
MSNGRKIDQMDKNIPTSSIAGPSKVYTNCDFWFEKKPSGNPDQAGQVLIRYLIF